MTPQEATALGGRLRIAFVLWDGELGGAETLTAAIAGVLRREMAVDARVVTIGRAGPLAERLRDAGTPFSELGFDRGRAVLRDPRRLADAVRLAGPDGVVLASQGFLALALRLGGYRGRIVAVEHGSILQTHRAHRRRPLVDRLDRLLGARAADVQVAVSSYLGRLAGGGPQAVTIPNGVDLDVYRPGPSRPDEAAFAVGCVSRLVPGKGVEDVLAAAKPVLARGARLRVAGDGPLRPALERLAGQLGIRDAVAFEGRLRDAAAVAGFWHGCDVAITAPDCLVESFGLVAVEAMACGLPVVATRAGALAETVADGETGILAAPGDTDALADALLAYMDDPALVAAHGAAARARCESEFDLRRCARAYLHLFRPERRPEPPAERRAVALRRASR